MWNRAILLVAAVASTTAPLSAADKSAKPNVLMICIDDLRPQLGCYGDAIVQSPNIDTLAARGLVFDRAYCQMALCSPSRISLLSGRRPATTRIYNIGPTLRSKLPDVVTLPQHFKANGYHAASIGKVYHVGIDDPGSWSEPSVQGGKPRTSPATAEVVKKWRAERKAAGKDPNVTGPESQSSVIPTYESVDCADGDLIDGDAARLGVERLQRFAADPSKPFFLAVGFVNPHVPWIAPKKYFELYDPAKLTLPMNNRPPKGAPEFAANTGNDFRYYTLSPKSGAPSPELGRRFLHAYLAAISYVDAQVGRLLAALDEAGLSKNTIVVLWGDHGYYMGEHGWWGGKHNNYEGATRVVLIVAEPGGKGRRTSALTEFVDLYPSLAELAGLPAPVGVEGTSFAPLLVDPNRKWKTAAFSQYPKGKSLGTAMRTERYRYVEWRDRTTDEL
ncbi:MAG: sulfatase, partial [Planctomycetia bacterium]